jgi:hypothetical protein
MFFIPDSLEIKQTDWAKKHKNDHGRGVFATQDIDGGTIIGDYLGTITKTEDEDEDKYGTYYLWYNDTSSVYADPQKPGVHIINHSCMPNCSMYFYKDRTLFFAVRKIFKGEELTVSYEMGAPDEGCDPCIHGCYCNTPLCKGTWHNAEKEEDESYVDEYEDGNAKPGTELQLLSSYPKSIKDDSAYLIFGSLEHSPAEYEDMTLPAETEIRKRIRETGRRLLFTKLHAEVWGVEDGLIILKTHIKNPAASMRG